ncbi:MAG: transposase [Deltaproteobacteria bacterium]|nr:transposase [Deltaproteobacteria bacterium]MBW2167664.1 transposase [Deltaproteobacteria bacterium]
MELSDPHSIERGVRQLLANKISGTMVGTWLLIPEYLRLGTWDLLKSWSSMPDEQVEPRLALQLINESALCVNGIRMKRTLSQKGFELANGLPFIATDPAIHNLLQSHCVADAQRLQIALGKVRQTFGHFNGKIIAIDPHRITSCSKRQMVRRQKDRESKPAKMAQTFFCLDAETKQPLCFTTASSATTVTQATPQLLTLASEILKLNGDKPLVMADNEHYTVELFDWIHSESPFDMLVPMPYNNSVLRSIRSLPEEAFRRHWAGYATAKGLYNMLGSRHGPYYQFIQRKGEQHHDYDFKAFLCTTDRDEMEDLSVNYPERWHIEEFFKNDQALGWHRAGTMNLNIRYGQMTMALIAQAASFMMRQRIGSPVDQWDAEHLAKDFFRGLEGDIRVQRDAIVVTYYNAPNPDLMKRHYENMPEKLSLEGIRPTIPWLYDFKLDFRFK